ncbi:type IV restriction-modification system/ Mrr cat superfamily [Synechococcus sp. A18-40]|nr:type IV restriction-modification system/ Mrr cat superfamily [Synechococcus sp. A18-40]
MRKINQQSDLSDWSNIPFQCKLANLMIQHGVGIQTREVNKISKIDLKFFSGCGD